MERESDLLHLFGQHQLIIFVVAALLIMALLLGVAFVLGKRAERRSKKGNQDETR